MPLRSKEAKHPYLSGNFAPITHTQGLTACSFEGRIPPELAGGQYVRNGANPIANEDLGREAHWFDGDGLLCGVFFRRVGEKGNEIQPEFVNQFLLTDLYCVVKSTKWITYPVMPSISTLINPLSSLFVIVFAVLRSWAITIWSYLARQKYPFKRISVSNTNVVYFDNRALALCESGPPLRFSLPGLETIGWYNGHFADNESDKSPGSGFGGDGLLSSMKEWTTAHPKVDPVSQELLAFHAVFVAPFLFYSVVSPESKKAAKVPSAFNLPVPGMKGSKMMHDFGVSRLHTVIMDLPLTLDPRNLVRGLPVLSYDATASARFGVFPRYEPHNAQWFETKACIVFHTANCWTSTPKTQSSAEPTSVHLLLCRLTSANVVFRAANIPTPESSAVPPEYTEEDQCRLYYYKFELPPDGEEKRIRHQWALSAIPFEFPTLPQAHSMQEARYVYGASTGGNYTEALGKAAKIDYLAKVDVLELIRRGLAAPPPAVVGCVDRRTIQQILHDDDPSDPIKLFQMPPGWYAQEPRFVPRRDATAEDDGWLLTYVFDESQLDEDGECRPDARSELWIIDAVSMKTVVAKVKLPQRVPYGLHGTFFSEWEIQNQRPCLRYRSLDQE